MLYISGVSKAKCSPNPCRNDGVCTAFEKHYECECPMGFMGKDCEGMLGGINYRVITTHGLSKYKAIHDHRYSECDKTLYGFFACLTLTDVT